ncbi:DUF6792 domain-containing protein [Companilactobacillus ginsenosidimutans]|uniref:DUF6792 domain-containing protein n=1 Tax=Companilactobacillus ginsenosidimutans TaxID=1007676 RepID=A0A0H4QXG1_9LACO|nr:DUF6792 domain-containing protein [Companilactobacillus ginsenosidimutans]AKP66175.1 hypothetical protein ABM34_00500 [Companilactobacillus ginsenosidimutans]
MKELLQTLDKLAKIYEQFDLLDFRAHKVIPLTFNKKDSKKLLPQNKRLYFSYQYLDSEKTRLTNLALNQIIDLKDDSFKANPELHPKLIDKALKLKNIDETHKTNAPNMPRRNRKINKLKQLIALIDDENLTLCRGYLTQIQVLIHSHIPQLSPQRNHPYAEQELLNNLDFRTDLMQFDYDRYLYEDFEPESFLRYLIYGHVQRIPSYVKSFDARDFVPEAEECGFSGIAYLITIDGISECYVTFKGTEADMDYTERSRTKRMEKFILEGYKDWNYNVNAILVGNTLGLDQMNAAEKFMTYLEDAVPEGCKMYGLGHSLGGHFVQTLQLVSNCFDKGYTLNSAPVQLKQVQLIKPDLIPDKDWKHLFTITKDKTITSDLNKEIQKLLPRLYPEIINESFEQDLTQVFYELPYTIWVGQKWEFNFSEWKYPFKIHPRQYMDLPEINSYQRLFEEFFARTQNATTGRQIMRTGISFAWDRMQQLRRDIDKPETARYFFDYSNYLYQSGIFKDEPKDVSKYFNEDTESSIWKSSRREWPFLRSLNRDMLELSIYFHIIYGSKHFLKKNPRKKI